MPRVQKLKVFRTPIGFHDAYVAAPSQKAALAAWRADSNLFAAGSAEQVDDPELTREPLARPGEVIRRVRGTLAEHIAALPKDPPGAKAAPRPTPTRPPDSEPERAARRAPARKPKPPPAPKPRPLPDRAPLNRAEAALLDAEKEHAAARSDIARRQAELDRERQALEQKQDKAIATLQQRVEAARASYDAKLRAWRAGD